MLDTIVALEPGHHTFVGSFQMTENGIVVKTKITMQQILSLN